MSTDHDSRQPRFADELQKARREGALPGGEPGVVSARVARAVFLEIASYASWQTGEGARPSWATISEATGISRRQVASAVRHLVAAGWLVVTREHTAREPAVYTCRLIQGCKSRTSGVQVSHLRGASLAPQGCKSRTSGVQVSHPILTISYSDPSEELQERAPEPAREREAVTAAAAAQTTEQPGLSTQGLTPPAPEQPEQSGDDAAMLDAWLMQELGEVGVSLSVAYATRLAAQLLRHGSLGASRAYVEGWIVRHGHDPDQARRALRWLYQDAAGEVPKYEASPRAKQAVASAQVAPDPERERRRQAERDLEAADALLDEERKRDPRGYYQRVQTEPGLIEAVQKALAARAILAGHVREVCA
jgi:hypothetical protein